MHKTYVNNICLFQTLSIGKFASSKINQLLISIAAEEYIEMCIN